MISTLDDYCLHQGTGYVSSPATTDRNFYDRYFFNGYSSDGAIAFGVAYGRYPNRMVEDAHFTVLVDGVQHSIHASDTTGTVGPNSNVGPLAVEVLDPMRTLRCRSREETDGIAYDLVFEAMTGAINEGPLVGTQAGIVWHNATRFMQYGRWGGWISVDGKRHEVSSARTFGLRDKSWGIRPLGEQLSAPRKRDSMFWMNVVMRLPDQLSIMRTSQGSNGEKQDHAGYFAPLHREQGSLPVEERDLQTIVDWDFELRFPENSRRVVSGVYTARLEDGSQREFEGRAINTFRYSGMGYNHRKWNHGLDHGGLTVERESVRAENYSETDPEGMFMCSVLEISEDGKVIGIGHTEHLFIGSYKPFGW